MATITITNLTSSEIYLRDLGTTLGKAGSTDSSLARLDTIVVTRSPIEAQRWSGVAEEIAVGHVTMTIIPSAEDASAHLDAPESTTSSIILYVEADGDDSNPGTEEAPLKSIQAALDKVPQEILHPVVIKIGAGNFDGAVVSNTNIGSADNPSEGAYLSLEGTLQTFTPATGVSSGAVASVSTTSDSAGHHVLSVTGAGWTANDLRGKLIETTGGTGAGQVLVISDNASGTLTVAGKFSPTPDATTTFEIKDWATVINTAVALPATGKQAMISNRCGLLITSTSGGTAAVGQVYCKNVKFATPGISVEVTLSNGTVPYFTQCSFNSTGSIQVNALDSIRIGKNAFHYAGTGSGIHIAVGGLLSAAGVWVDSGCVFENGMIGVSAPNANNVTLSNCRSIGTKTLLALNGQTGNIQITGGRFDGSSVASSACVSGSFSNSINAHRSFGIDTSDISNFATGVDIEANCVGRLGTVSGTGNTTGVKLSKGARLQITSAATLTGTTEISLDGASSSLATMRAASPKHVKDATYGTLVYE